MQRVCCWSQREPGLVNTGTKDISKDIYPSLLLPLPSLPLSPFPYSFKHSKPPPSISLSAPLLSPTSPQEWCCIPHWHLFHFWYCHLLLSTASLVTSIAQPSSFFYFTQASSPLYPDSSVFFCFFLARWMDGCFFPLSLTQAHTHIRKLDHLWCVLIVHGPWWGVSEVEQPWYLLICWAVKSPCICTCLISI